jgi:hypothetical protein
VEAYSLEPDYWHDEAWDHALNVLELNSSFPVKLKLSYTPDIIVELLVWPGYFLASFKGETFEGEFNPDMETNPFEELFTYIEKQIPPELEPTEILIFES